MNGGQQKFPNVTFDQKSVGIQCTMLDVQELLSEWTKEKEVADEHVHEWYKERIDRIRKVYEEVVNKYSEDCKRMMVTYDEEKLSLMKQLEEAHENLNILKAESTTGACPPNRSSISDMISSPDLKNILEECKLSLHESQFDQLREAMQSCLQELENQRQPKKTSNFHGNESASCTQCQEMELALKKVNLELSTVRQKLENEVVGSHKLQEELSEVRSVLQNEMLKCSDFRERFRSKDAEFSSLSQQCSELREKVSLILIL